MSICALVPFKGTKAAKRRLGCVLDASDREGLVLAMVRDVLTALVASDGLGGVVVVSRDEVGARLAEEFGVEVFADSAADLSGAVAEASAHARTRNAISGTLFVPGDVPLIGPEDIAAILDGHRQVTVVPDAHDIGTNALATSPPNAFGYLFDGKSFKPHLAAAKRAGLETRVVRRPNFGIDVDTVAELAAVAAQAPASSHTGAFLRSSGIAERLFRCGFSRETASAGRGPG